MLNDVVLNQVLLRFGDDETHARHRARPGDGTCWLGGTVWHGRAAMRISVSNWSTTEADIDRTADAILAAAPEAGAWKRRIEATCVATREAARVYVAH